MYRDLIMEKRMLLDIISVEFGFIEAKGYSTFPDIWTMDHFKDFEKQTILVINVPGWNKQGIINDNLLITNPNKQFCIARWTKRLDSKGKDKKLLMAKIRNIKIKTS